MKLLDMPREEFTPLYTLGPDLLREKQQPGKNPSIYLEVVPYLFPKIQLPTATVP